MGHLSPDTFPLPTLGPVLRDLARELHSGRGFFVLRNLPWTPTRAPISSDIHRCFLLHRLHTRLAGQKLWCAVSYQGSDPDTQRHWRACIHHRQASVPYRHGSRYCILFALQTAAEGGTSRISSSWRVYNELAATRPDLVRTLAEPWPFEEFNSDPPYAERPLLYYLDFKLILQYARRYFTAQAEALDALHSWGEVLPWAEFPEGDIQYINNLGIFHARDGFKDNEKQARHLLRLWLRNEELAWETPQALKPLWDKTFAAPPDEQTFALDPVVRAAVKGKE
ncbi:hypothetical protein BD779DRAFT_1671450 [Infundibulicybe gibba]|nr:hypothetical protein BD779DRAFT_1671450 [Infundibulicybe gibba]